MKISIGIWIALIILQIIDAVTTLKIIKAGGIETGFFMKPLSEEIGIVKALVISKTLIIAVIGLILWMWPMPFVQVVMAVLAVYYGWVAWHNYRQN